MLVNNVAFDERGQEVGAVDKIALIGPMGVGKSTVGRALAEHLGAAFVDLDAYIEVVTCKTIPEIFSDAGEAMFRQLEAQALQQITTSPSRGCTVCATGGGIVTSRACRQLLQQSWFVVYLTAATPTLVSHLAGEAGGRPLLQDAASLEQRVAKLVAERQPLYCETAHVTVEVDQQSVSQVVAQVVGALPA